MRLWPFVLILTACGTGKSDDSGAPAGPATFTEVRDDILLKSCALSGGCHLPGEEGDTDGELPWDPANPGAVYATLVNATAATGKVLVTPGDVNNSFLMVKITGEQGADEGDPMPPPFGLNADTQARIASWIEDGAQDN